MERRGIRDHMRHAHACSRGIVRAIAFDARRLPGFPGRSPFLQTPATSPPKLATRDASSSTIIALGHCLKSTSPRTPPFASEVKQGFSPWQLESATNWLHPAGYGLVSAIRRRMTPSVADALQQPSMNPYATKKQQKAARARPVDRPPHGTSGHMALDPVASASGSTSD